MRLRFAAAVAIVSLALPLSAGALSLSSTAQQIEALLAEIAALQAKLNSYNAASGSGGSAPVSSAPVSAPAGASGSSICYALTRSLSLGSSGSDVLALQKYLAAQGLLASGSATGYFDLATQAAVQHWQAAYGVVSSGTPATTGYGVVGPRTRQMLQLNCHVGETQAQSCPLAPQPSVPCAGTWHSIANASGCVTAWQCEVPLPQAAASTTSAPSQCLMSPARPTNTCSSGTWLPVAGADGCIASWQCKQVACTPQFSLTCPSGSHVVTGSDCSQSCVLNAAQ